MSFLNKLFGGKKKTKIQLHVLVGGERLTLEEEAIKTMYEAVLSVLLKHEPDVEFAWFFEQAKEIEIRPFKKVFPKVDMKQFEELLFDELYKEMCEYFGKEKLEQVYFKARAFAQGVILTPPDQEPENYGAAFFFDY